MSSRSSTDPGFNRILRALRDNEERLLQALEAARVGTFEWSSDGDRVTRSAMSTEVFGLVPGSIYPSGDEGFDLVHPDDRARHRAAFERAARTGDVLHAEFRVIRPIDGRIAWIEERGHGWHDPISGAMRVCGVHWDITDRKRTDAARCDSEEKYRCLIESFAQAVWQADASGFVSADSPSWRAYTGQTIEEWLGYGWINAVHPDDRMHAEQQWREAVSSHRPIDAEFRLRHALGGWRWTNFRATPVCADDGTILKWIGMNVDINARKVEESAVREGYDRQAFLLRLSDAIRPIDDPEEIVTLSCRLLAEHLHVDSISYTESKQDALAPAGHSAAVDIGPLLMKDGRWVGMFRIQHRIPRVCSLAETELLQDVADRLWAALEHIRSDATLRESQQRMQAADQQKDEFLSTLAHELRNPLATIRNATELLARRVPQGSDLALACGMAQRQSEQLTRLVGDLSDVARIAHGRIALDREALEIGRVLELAIESVEPALRQKNHRLARPQLDQTLYVYGDRSRLVQALSNLLLNAAKYTDPGGEISIELTQQRARVQLKIRDNGCGIAPDLLTRIFDLFTQGDRTSNRAHGGLGIGLFVVQRLIEMHSGTVIASSDGAGKGASFVVDLPVIEAPATAPLAQLPSPMRSLRILVVDDNVDAAEAVKLLLIFEGHVVETAYAAQQALKIADQFRPEFILLDIGMPDIDGYEIARCLRANPHLQSARLVALTGYGQQIESERTAGFDHHLVKPATLEAMEKVFFYRDV
ncbi:MAG TPA: PAS domain-containing protein [Steroidobacteraceae bacterium]